MYLIKPKVEIPDGARVVLPISLEQTLHTGDALRALLNFYKKYNPVVLLADTLHRFNHDHATARAKGDHFIASNADILGDFTLIRWDQWISKYPDEIEETKQLLTSQCLPGSLLYEKCQLTAEKCHTRSNLENSLSYQIEEYAVLLVMAREFDYLVYPRAATEGMSVIYKLFADIPKPVYVNANTINIPLEHYQVNKLKPLPLSLRLLLDQIESVFASGEISAENKLKLVARIEDLVSVFNLAPVK